MKKRDFELMKQVKRGEKAKRGQQQQEQAAQTVEIIDETIDFDMWWVEISKTLKLPFHLKEVVWADFKARGLKSKSLKADFDAAMRLFGYAV